MRADKDNQAAVLEGATRILVAARKKSFKRGAFQNPFVFIWQKAAAKVEPMRKATLAKLATHKNDKSQAHSIPDKKLGQTRLIIGV